MRSRRLLSLSLQTSIPYVRHLPRLVFFSLREMDRMAHGNCECALIAARREKNPAAAPLWTFEQLEGIGGGRSHGRLQTGSREPGRESIRTLEHRPKKEGKNSFPGGTIYSFWDRICRRKFRISSFRMDLSRYSDLNIKN